MELYYKLETLSYDDMHTSVTFHLKIAMDIATAIKRGTDNKVTHV